VIGTSGPLCWSGRPGDPGEVSQLAHSGRPVLWPRSPFRPLGVGPQALRSRPWLHRQIDQSGSVWTPGRERNAAGTAPDKRPERGSRGTRRASGSRARESLWSNVDIRGAAKESILQENATRPLSQAPLQPAECSRDRLPRTHGAPHRCHKGPRSQIHPSWTRHRSEVATASRSSR
jgi:hypothetical protein